MKRTERRNELEKIRSKENSKRDKRKTIDATKTLQKKTGRKKPPKIMVKKKAVKKKKNNSFLEDIDDLKFACQDDLK